MAENNRRRIAHFRRYLVFITVFGVVIAAELCRRALYAATRRRWPLAERSALAFVPPATQRASCSQPGATGLRSPVIVAATMGGTERDVCRTSCRSWKRHRVPLWRRGETATPGFSLANGIVFCQPSREGASPGTRKFQPLVIPAIFPATNSAAQESRALTFVARTRQKKMLQ